MDDPDVSVVVTVKDDPRVADCVEAILDQETGFAFEVVVDVDGSTDGTAEIVEDRFGDDDRVTVLRLEGGVAAAWSEAARQSGGRVVARTDADAIPEPGWLASLTGPILDGDADWTAGRVVGVNPDGNLVERYFHERTEAFYRRVATRETISAAPSWNVAYRREVLEELGAYDPWLTSSEDRDLHHRMAGAGNRGVYVPEAVCRHHHPDSLGELLAKEAWYRTGTYQVGLKHGFGEVAPTLALPGAYALVIVVAIAGLVAPLLGWLALGLVVLLVAKHLQGGLAEDDPVWYLRALFRPLEALAGLWGMLRGVARYGVSPPGAADPGGSVEEG